VTQRKASKGATVPAFALGADLDGEEELTVGLPPATAATEVRPAAAAPAVDLSHGSPSAPAAAARQRCCVTSPRSSSTAGARRSLLRWIRRTGR
jgi:hypothetical protein